jgi:TetR/AcrR family transcriptional repressor of nem operon
MSMNQGERNTRERILDVGQDLVQRRGINGMSFQDLSDAVGIRKASVHHHFASKTDMVTALLERYRSEFGREVGLILKSRKPAAAKLKAYFGLFTDTLEQPGNNKGCLCGMLAAELLSLEAENVEQVRGFFRENYRSIEQILNEGRSDASLPFARKTETMARLVFSALEGALLVARCDGGPRSMKVALESLLVLLSAA